MKVSNIFKVCMVFFAIGIALICWGAYIPPKGEVSGSLLKAFGMIITGISIFLGIETAQMAIRKGTDASIKMGNTEVAINSQDNENE